MSCIIMRTRSTSACFRLLSFCAVVAMQPGSGVRFVHCLEKRMSLTYYYHPDPSVFLPLGLFTEATEGAPRRPNQGCCMHGHRLERDHQLEQYAVPAANGESALTSSLPGLHKGFAGCISRRVT
ncbi:hypothetical protein OH76DRAFT_173539 [Lentinus brumalis]|uniref:Secreted protein n=1 Tax=Lentinus brumalis TaxID=2498619 RepID=A0A371DJC3_9APHY|nr:hypothetical protein OH76DRAFT_173539 [Polyporus brumalis]